MTPVKVPVPSSVVDIADGAYDHALALDQDGNAYSWGLNMQGSKAKTYLFFVLLTLFVPSDNAVVEMKILCLLLSQRFLFHCVRIFVDSKDILKRLLKSVSKFFLARTRASC